MLYWSPKENKLTSKKRSFLQVPQGTEGIYLEEAYRHRKIAEEVNSIFLSWGYLPVQTPVIDFYDLYRPMVEGRSENLYRLIDREGELLLLRNDITLFLAKQMGLALRREDLPVRVSYSDIILRHQDREDIAKNEFFQTGAELIGKEGIYADLEILSLLFRVLDYLDLPVSVHIGSKSLFTALFGKLYEKTRVALRNSINLRQLLRQEELLLKDFGKKKTSFYLDLFQFIGTSAELISFLASLPDGLLKPEERTNLDHLLSIEKELALLGYTKALRIDLSEIGNQPYHTGIVFQVYMDGTDSAIASGGRYDKLLENFGFPCPSVGFSLLLRKVEPFVKNRESYVLPKRVRVRGDSFRELFLKAEEERKKGRIAVL